MKNKILHITNDYSGSTVYKNLIRKIDNIGISQIVYNPIRDKSRINKNRIEFQCEESEIIYSNILNYYSDRLFFTYKIKKILKDIHLKVKLDNLKLVHAHTWFSDGAVAFELFKLYNIPYIVTIRNTDLNVFYSKMIHLRKYGLDILTNAKKIIFISEVYHKRFLELNIIKKRRTLFYPKLKVIYNGVDDFWLENYNTNKRNFKKEIFKIIYIGKFDKGKNVPRLIEAVKEVNLKYSCSLTLIGGGGSDSNFVEKQCEKYGFIDYLGPIYEKDKIKDLFQESHLFAMPSKAETFGLVYIEALSQSLPILNTINEGIYGMYTNVGESVIHNSIPSIRNGIIKIIENYSKYEISVNSILANHSWSEIAQKYINIYNGK